MGSSSFLQAVGTAMTALASVSAIYVNDALTVFPRTMLEEAISRAVHHLMPAIVFNNKVRRMTRQGLG